MARFTASAQSPTLTRSRAFAQGLALARGRAFPAEMVLKKRCSPNNSLQEGWTELIFLTEPVSLRMGPQLDRILVHTLLRGEP